MSVLIGEAGGRRPSAPLANLLTSLVVSSPAGSVNLMAKPWRVRSGSRGLTVPTGRPDVVSLPGRDGVARRRLSSRSVMYDAREIELPLFLGQHPSVGTPERLSREVDRLQDVVDEDMFPAGEVTLTGYRADGTSRFASVVHAPIAGDMDPVAWWQTSWQPTLRLLAPDPFPRSAAKPITWEPSASTSSMLPFVPLRVGSSTLIGKANRVTVLGNKQAWPTVRVVGPASSITCMRGDGSSWTLVPPAPLTVGQSVRVRHDPSVGVSDDLETVEGPAGQPWYRYLQAGSRLWGLRPGVETVTIAITGLGASTAASIAWDHRFRSFL